MRREWAALPEGEKSCFATIAKMSFAVDGAPDDSLGVSSEVANHVMHGLADERSLLSVVAFEQEVRRILGLADDIPVGGFSRYHDQVRQEFQRGLVVHDSGVACGINQNVLIGEALCVFR